MSARWILTSNPVMPDCRGVGEIPYIFKACEKSPFAGFVPQSGITGRTMDLSFFLSERNERLA